MDFKPVLPPTIESTIEFIQLAHAGQVDKAGNPYYLHPLAVMNRLPEWVDDEVRMAALLHDVLEDTDYTREDLLKLGYSERTLAAVELVTKHDDGKTYFEKVQSIIDSGNEDAIEIKFADMSENTNPARMALLPLDKQEYFRNKYTAPLKLLTEAVNKIALNHPSTPAPKGGKIDRRFVH